MTTGRYKLGRQTGNRGFYAEVTVSTTPAEVSSSTVATGAFAWLKEDYGPNAYEWSFCDEYREGALFGARYALAHLAQPTSEVLVNILQIRAHPAHSDRDCVAFAACHATWQALGDLGLNHPRLESDRVVFEGR
jgi:hypothetical protein